MGMEASDSTTSFFLSPEQQEDADSFFLSRGVGLRRESGRCLSDEGPGGPGWAERFRIFHADVMHAADEDCRPDARSAELAAKQCVQDVSIRSLCAALVCNPRSSDLGEQMPTALATPEPPEPSEPPAALELLDAPTVDDRGRTSEQVWSLQEMSVASEVVREVRRPTRPMRELAAGANVPPPPRPPQQPEHASPPRAQQPPAEAAWEPARLALPDEAPMERPRPPPLDVEGMEAPEQEEEAPTHYFFGEHGWQPVQVVEMEMPAELAMAGAAYGYYSVVQDERLRLEVGPAVPDAHVYAVAPPAPPELPAPSPAPSPEELRRAPSSPASSEPAASERPPSEASRRGGNPRRVRTRGKRPEQGRSRSRAEAAGKSKADAPGQIILFGNSKPSFATVETASSWRKRSESPSPWETRTDSRTSSGPTKSTRPSTRDSSAGAAVQSRAPEMWSAAVEAPAVTGPPRMTWPDMGGHHRALPPDDEDSDEEEAARREMAEVEAEFELYPFAKPAAGGGGQLRSLRLLQELKR